MSPTLQVTEIFVSVQGEGPSAGEPALFLRLANCNLSCVWCDSRFTWDWETFDNAREVERIHTDALRDRVLRELPDSVHLLVLTGGEPLVQQSAVAPLLHSLRSRRPDLRVEVETNGTIAPSADLADEVHLFVVSPKLANSAVTERRRLRMPVLVTFAGTNAVLKVVVDTPAELAEAAMLAQAAGFAPERVWIMPQTTSPARLGALLADLAPGVIARGFKLSSRLHVFAWADARGR